MADSSVLVNEESGDIVKVGDEVTDFRGEVATVRGWRVGSHPGSTGRIVVADGWGAFGQHEYYPSVYGCKVVDLTDHPSHDEPIEGCDDCAEKVAAMWERMQRPY